MSETDDDDLPFRHPIKPIYPTRDQPHQHRWRRYKIGGKDWKICKWCGEIQRPGDVKAPPANEQTQEEGI